MNKFERACEASLNDWLATIPDEIPKFEYSEKHKKWRRILFDKMRGDRYHRFTIKTVKVMMIAATLSTLLLTAFAYPSSREFIIDNFDIFSRYQISEPNNNSVTGEITVGYIPEGYEFVNVQKSSKAIIYDYYDSNGNVFTITKGASALELDTNTEDVDTEIIVINNNTYYYCLGKNNFGNLIWSKDDYVFRISGTVSKDELLEIAEEVN